MWYALTNESGRPPRAGGGVTMPTCQNCESFVTTQYAKVFTPPSEEEPRVCPHCPDKLRDGATVREARSTRNG
jgi:hypothetical protein